MKKKEYKFPTIRVVEINSGEILSGSIIPKGDPEDKPEPNENGDIIGDSKRGGLYWSEW